MPCKLNCIESTITKWFGMSSLGYIQEAAKDRKLLLQPTALYRMFVPSPRQGSLMGGSTTPNVEMPQVIQRL